MGSKKKRGIPQPDTPTLNRLQAQVGDAPCRLVDHSNLIGEFLDWLEAQGGVLLAKYGVQTYDVPVYRHELTREERGPAPEGVDKGLWLEEIDHYETHETDERLIPLGKGPSKLLHEYFDIDPDEEEREKRALLEWIRASNG
jgi:hypothetical protein